jgi:hypothetical protein
MAGIAAVAVAVYLYWRNDRSLSEKMEKVREGKELKRLTKLDNVQEN